MWTKSGLLNGEDTTEEWMIDAFNRHTEEVKAHVPAERLLVWSPKDGWDPLCEFLEVPVPEAPLPNINDIEVLRRAHHRRRADRGAEPPRRRDRSRYPA